MNKQQKAAATLMVSLATVAVARQTAVKSGASLGLSAGSVLLLGTLVSALLAGVAAS